MVAKYQTFRERGPLTTEFIASSSKFVQGMTQVCLLVDYTKGSSSLCEIKIEFSGDNVNWYQESVIPELILFDSFPIHLPCIRKLIDIVRTIICIPICTRYMRVSARAVGSSDGTSLFIEGVMDRI